MVKESVRVIIVEDDRELRESLVDYLNLNGFAARGVGSGLEFYRALTNASYAVAVIDVGLPDQSGFVLSEYVRKNTAMGVVILTAWDTINDKLQGYGSGADLYLVKPVDCRELSSAIRNLAARLDGHAPSSVPASAPGEWRLVRQAWNLVTPDGLSIQLTAREMKFLTCLAEIPDKPVSRGALLAILGYTDDEYANRAMDSLVRRLRRKIEVLSCQTSPIKTVYSIGYSFSAPIVIV